MTEPTYVYMNDKVKGPPTDEPVVVAQYGDAIVEGRRADFYHEGVLVASVVYDPGADVSPEYSVKAFVVTDKCEVRVR